MAHFAELDENNVVLRVLVVPNEVEHRGEEYLRDEIGLGGRWIQTSYNATIRGKYATPGDIYYPEFDAFGMEEKNITEYIKLWNGYSTPTSPSLFIDSIQRVGNIYLNVLMNRAFSFPFQRWSLKFHHNPESFAAAIPKFDLVLAPIRLPIDSIASWVNLSQSIDYRDSVNDMIDQSILVYQNILANKDNLMIAEFEDFIANPVGLINAVGQRMNLTPSAVDLEEVESFIRTLNDEYDSFYSMPIDNRDEIDAIKPILLADEEYAPKIEVMTNLYNQLSAFKVIL